MIAEFKNLAIHAMAWLPFISAAVVSHTQLNISSFVSRMLETAIIGGIIMYTNVQILNVKLQDLQSDIKSIQTHDTKNENLAREIRKDVNKILIDLERLKTKHEIQDNQSRN